MSLPMPNLSKLKRLAWPEFMLPASGISNVVADAKFVQV